MNIKLTPLLKGELSKIQNPEDKVKFLQNKYDGQECYILGCGPSLLEYDRNFLRNHLRDKLVLSIKQSQLIIDDPDFHFINDNNIIPYRSNPNTINMFSSSSAQSLALVTLNNPGYDPDIFTQIEPPIEQKALCNTLKFDDYLLSKRLLRPWGPGIISEIVFYLAVHLGVKKICTIGWDLSNTQELKEGAHFYDKYISKNDMINPARIDIEKNTQAKNITMSGKINQWLSTHHIELVTASKNTHIHDSIKRITL